MVSYHYFSNFSQGKDRSVSILKYDKQTHTDQYHGQDSYYQISCMEQSLFNYKFLSGKNGQQRITNNNLLQLQYQTQVTGTLEEEISKRVNLPYVISSSKKLWCINKSHKIRSTFNRKLKLLSKKYTKLRKFTALSSVKQHRFFEDDDNLTLLYLLPFFTKSSF